MSEFKKVSVVKTANVYFDGKVTSRTVKFSDGSKKTLGFMQAGDYEFATEQKEIMEVLAGEAKVLLPNTNSWQLFKAGDEFNVAANASFKLEVAGFMDYCCSYVD